MGKIFVIKAVDKNGKELTYREPKFRVARSLQRLKERKDVDLTAVKIYEVISDGDGGEILILVHGDEYE